MVKIICSPSGTKWKHFWITENKKTAVFQAVSFLKKLESK
jgi:hypothetical protein